MSVPKLSLTEKLEPSRHKHSAQVVEDEIVSSDIAKLLSCMLCLYLPAVEGDDEAFAALCRLLATAPSFVSVMPSIPGARPCLFLCLYTVRSKSTNF